MKILRNIKDIPSSRSLIRFEITSLSVSRFVFVFQTIADQRQSQMNLIISEIPSDFRKL
jgi:hypothetical protein